MMEELTRPVELTDQELDLVAAGCYHKSREGSETNGGNFAVQINGVDIGGNQQNSNNGSSNSALSL
jgi:hypothetical protein